MKKYSKMKSHDWSNLMLDSIYKPHFNVLEPYIGNEREFLDWMHYERDYILKQTNKKDNSNLIEKVKKQLYQTSLEMQNFTNYPIYGKWVVLFGSGTVDLGGFDDGTMLIDLTHDSNKNLDHIFKMLPHEINHQIYSNFLKQDENKVLHRIIGEGFACYVSYKFNKEKNPIYEELIFTKKEYEFCKKFEKGILHILKKNYKSNDEDKAKQLTDREHHYLNIYPGALGYYIGFRIIEEYVKIHGEDSWRDIYQMKPMEVLRKSKIIEIE
ncbi:DUF2268 domain-containing putative Zn-dependent protease [Aureivirga sp. CE67]|uniref:DUF2268 domain-containing putative Zn-dependent protease n=1 Tax=Aureivirga sp. CE67 TaxID=1788983 RepID=UPI0018CA75CF|nr:DUF2268 domain-containing putative Zn-dependent protease [Aureivirga sp. CE67]